MKDRQAPQASCIRGAGAQQISHLTRHIDKGADCRPHARVGRRLRDDQARAPDADAIRREC